MKLNRSKIAMHSSIIHSFRTPYNVLYSHAFFKEMYSLCCWRTSMHVLQKLPTPALIINSTNQMCLGVALDLWLLPGKAMHVTGYLLSLFDSSAFLFPSFSFKVFFLSAEISAALSLQFCY